MKKIFLTVLAAGALHAAATAQTNSTNRESNGGGHMNNRGVGVDDGTLPAAGRDGSKDVKNEKSTREGASYNANTANGTSTNVTNRDGGMMGRDSSAPATVRVDASVTIGGMNRTEFDRMNAEGNRKVAAISPTSTPLSKADQKLLIQMAQGGIMQLQVSQAAVGRLQRDDVTVLAKGEVEEQTAVSAKILEIARAKGMVLNTEPTAATRQILLRIQQTTSGADLDKYYTRESGVNGHERLMKTGEKVMREAQDPALRALAEATAPVIKMHMQVSQGVLDQIEKGNSGHNSVNSNPGR